MKRLQILGPGALAGLCVLASGAWVTAGPVTYQSQSRRISAQLRETYELPDDTLRLSDADSATAPDLGDWDASVTARIDDPPLPGAPGISTVSQRSSLSDAGITAAGEGRGQADTMDGSYGFDTALDVTFALDERRNFRLDYLLGAGTFFESSETIRLTRTDGGTVIFGEVPEFGTTPPDGDAVGTRTGQLSPGQYRFEFRYDGGSDIGNSIPYSVSLALTPTDGGPGPNPIPLPPAAWSALATAGAFSIVRLRRLARRP